MLINVKMPTIVGILTLISMTHTALESSNKKQSFFIIYYFISETYTFSA